MYVFIYCVVKDEWGPWLEWSSEKDGFSVRIRNCLKEGGNCAGKNVQKRKVIKRVITETG